MSNRQYRTAGGITVDRAIDPLPVDGAIDHIVLALNERRGVLLASSYEYPGRYTRWDIGFVDPPLELVCRGRQFQVRALNERGQVLLPPIEGALLRCGAVANLFADRCEISGTVRSPLGRFPEEERSK